MVDLIKISLKAGKGGDGRISFHSNRYQIKGGPDGGDGGDGGSIVAVGDQNLHSLRDYAGRVSVDAADGQMGGKTKSFGMSSPDLKIMLPVGTAIWRVISEFVPKRPKHMYTFTLEGERKEWLLSPHRRLDLVSRLVPRIYSAKSGGPKLTKTFTMGERTYEAELVGELTKDGQKIKVVSGGKAGRGNYEFRSSTHTTPVEAETGEGGESGTFFFELQVLADIGFVGFPNAGKSTLLSVLTKSKPQIANYPFTTLEPNLGILEYPSRKEGERATFVVADIPGILEGASEGKGLGAAFLRHIERSKLLLFVLSLEDYDVLEYGDDIPVLVEKLSEQYQQLVQELEEYEEQMDLKGNDAARVPMMKKKRLVVINKADLYSEELQNQLSTRLGEVLEHPLFISAKANFNIDKLKSYLRDLLN